MSAGAGEWKATYKKKISCLPEWFEGFQTRKQIRSDWRNILACEQKKNVSERTVADEFEVYVRCRRFTTQSPTDWEPIGRFLFIISLQFISAEIFSDFFPQKERTRAPEIGQTPKNHFTTVRSCVQKLVVCVCKRNLCYRRRRQNVSN